MSTSNATVPCLVCGVALTIRTARGRKSGKPFLMVICAKDGRHFRGFIADQKYVKDIFDKLEEITS